jgi:Spy/CpxP family protein refolding chaperone
MKRRAATFGRLLRLIDRTDPQRGGRAMHLRKLIVVLSLAIPATATVAYAQSFAVAGPPGPPLPMSLMMMIRHANLTPEQQARVHQIMGSSLTRAQPLMKQLKDINDQIGDKLMSAGPLSASELEPLQQQENRIHQQLDEQSLTAALQIRGLLTPQQLAKAADLHNKLKSLRQQMDALIGENGPMMIMGGPPPGF